MGMNLTWRIARPAIMAAAFLGWAVPSSADVVLAEGGQPRATIVTASGASAKVQVAAAELRTYLAKLSGATLLVASDAARPAGVLVLVGRSRLTDQLKVKVPAGLTNARREEGFVVECGPSWVALAGNDEGPYHGTEYAVYDLLDRLGVRWYMPGDFGEVVPHLPTVRVPDLHVRQKPDFIMRNWWLHITPELAEQERRWKLRNRMNPDAMFAVPGDSSARNVLPESRYLKAHPDYFALNPDGSRNPYLPNLTSPGAVEAAAETIKEQLRKDPAANSYGFAPDDGLPRDFNPETLQLNGGFVTLGGRPGVPGEVSTTEEWIQFVNKVAAAVRKDFPDVFIATNGYANRNNPPEGVALDDHLVIMFAAIWSCTLHAYDDPHCYQKVRQAQMLKRWCELCKNVWVYGYNDQMLVSALTPLPETRKLRRDIPLMHRWGVIGFFDEYRNQWAESGIASRYLRARLEWNASADVDAVLADFYAGWYGPAAAPMRAFYEAIEDSIQASPLHGHEDRVLPFVYTPALLGTLRRRAAEAEQVAADAPERVRTHVRADRLILTHLEAYMAMSAAESRADFAGAAREAARMMEARRQLHAIDPFFVWSDEKGYHTGIWYWGVQAREEYYRSLADRTSGKTGDLVALLPDSAQFRTDPHDDGVFAAWYRSGAASAWGTVSTTRPFYAQGYADAQGHPYVGTIWYRWSVQLPESARGKKVSLYIPVVETEAWAWVNGRFVAYRPYAEAYTRPCPLECDVGDALLPGARNDIVIRVSTGLSPEQAADGVLSRGFLYTPRPAAR
jgi:hypothetical protein